MAQPEQIATTATPATPGAAPPRGLTFIIGAMVFAAIITVAYWVIWYGVDHNMLASSHAPSYFTFENACSS